MSGKKYYPLEVITVSQYLYYVHMQNFLEKIATIHFDAHADYYDKDSKSDHGCCSITCA